MGFELIPFAAGLMQKQAVNEVIKCNDFTGRFGLVLTQAQALELIKRARKPGANLSGCSKGNAQRLYAETVMKE